MKKYKNKITKSLKSKPVTKIKKILNYIPKYMLPSKLVVMDAFPHTANDKIDRVTLKKSLSQ